MRVPLKKLSVIIMFFPLICFSNLVKNPDFEQSRNHWKSYWNGFSISPVAHDGKKSLLLEFKESIPGKPCGAYQKVVLNQETAAPITIALWYKAENVVKKSKARGDNGSWCRLRISAVTGDDKAIWNRDAKRQSMQFDFEGTSDWKYKERTFIFNQPIKFINLYIQGRACTGKAWFDDIYVRSVKVESLAVSDNYQACRLKSVGNVIVMENQFIKITLNKNLGGRISSFIDKVSGKEFTENSAKGGVMKDIIAEAGFSTFFKQFYFSKINSNSPEKLSVVFTGQSERKQFFKIQKTYTITRNSNELDIDYKLLNGKEAMAAQCFTLRNHNVFKIKGEKNNYYFPTSKGVKKIAEGSEMQAWHKDIVSGWSAFIAPKSQVGLVCTVDYSALDCFYNWFGEQTTLEWFFKTVRIQNGSDWQTRINLMPIHKLASIDAAKPGIAIAFEDLDTKTTEFKLAIASGTREKVDIELKAENLKTGGKLLIKRLQTELSADRTNKYDIAKNQIQNGNFLLVCTVYDKKNKKIIEAKRLFASDSEKLQYVFKPEKEKLPTISGIKPAELNQDLVTPHIKWAKPLEKGRIKVLGIVHDFSARELVELAQRLDMDYTPVIFYGGHSPPDYFMSYSIKDSNNWLREKLKGSYDVILIGGINGTCFSRENEETILEKVRNGCGLVYVYPNCISKVMRELLPLKPPVGRASALSGKWRISVPHYITSGIPFNALPMNYGFKYTAKNPIITCASNPLAAVRELPKGRVAALGYPVACTNLINVKWLKYGGVLPTAVNPYFVPEIDLLYPYWEYYYAFLAKTVIWAAGKAPESRIQQIKIEDNVCRIKIKSTDTSAKDILWELKDNTFKTIESGNIKLSTTLEIIKIPLKRMYGNKFLHLRLCRGNKILDFAARKVSYKQPLTIANINADFSMDKSGTARLKAKLSASGSGMLKVKLVDGYNRLVAQKEMKVYNSEGINFELKFRNPLSRAYHLEIQPFFDGLPGDCYAKWIYLRTGRKRFNDYNVDMWLMDFSYFHRPEYLRDMQYDRFSKNLVNSVQLHNSGWQKIPDHLSFLSEFLWKHNLEVALNNLAPLHIGTKDFNENKKLYADTKSIKYLCRVPCLHDPKYISSVKDRIKTMVSPIKAYEPMFYCFGDESSLTQWSQKFDFCFSENTLKHLRGWLKKKYGSIAYLNKVYGTAYNRFSEVVPLNSEEAQKKKNYSSWLDHRYFMEKTMADFYEMAKAEVEKHDPGCPVSLSGTQNPTAYNGSNWYLLMQVFKNQCMAPYSGIQSELMSSFGGVGFRALPYDCGYGNVGNKVYYNIWKHAFLYKGTGVSFYIDDIALKPDFTISRQFEDMTNATADLRNGIGKILLESQRLSDGLGIIYNPQAEKIASITNQSIVYNNSVQGWSDLLNAAGYQYKFIAPEQLNQLVGSDIRVLILPFCLALSEREIKLLQKFAADGGIVITDAALGIFDGNGCKATGNEIGTFFGIKRKTGASCPGSLKLNKLTVPVTLYNDSIRARQALALATVNGKPAVFVNQRGKGKTIYLNFLLNQYPNLRTAPSENNKFLKLLDTLFTSCNIKHNLATVTQTTGAPAQQYRMFNFQSGCTKYLALIRHMDGHLNKEELKINLNRKYHVYDVRNHKYLGYKKEFCLSLPVSASAFFALEPEKIENVTIETNRQNATGGSEINYSVKVNSGQNTVPQRVVKVEVYSPSGSLMNHYSRNIFSSTGKITGKIQTALNDHTGKWKIKATDVASGISNTTCFELK